MKKDFIKTIVKKYLQVFPNEKERLERLNQYLEKNNEKSLCDWNNSNGHLTAGGFLYSIKTKKFLVLWHKDLKMFLYPGGHCECTQKSPLETATVEVIEETGIDQFKVIGDNVNKDVPIDIDTHIIPYNPRVNMPKHYHFDFRYLFVVEDEKNVKIDESEISEYKWIDEKELSKDKNYGNIISKLKNLI